MRLITNRRWKCARRHSLSEKNVLSPLEIRKSYAPGEEYLQSRNHIVLFIYFYKTNKFVCQSLNLQSKA